jgi:1-acyl-sn-glycerol-3-phosphate acyltransferase
MYSFIKNIATLILKIFYRMRIEGVENVPAEGGFVLACTHTGWLDIIALGVCTPRPIHYMAKIELFKMPLVAWFLSKLNSFPVNRDNPGPSSLKTPIRLLKKGEVVGIFPSGTRTKESVPLKRGAAYLADRAQVPIVPAVYEGPEALRWGDLFKGKKIVIRFGEPIAPDNEESDRQQSLLTRLNERMEILAEGNK